MLQILMNVNLELQTVMQMQFALILKEPLPAPVLPASLVMEEFVITVSCTYNNESMLKMYIGNSN